MDPINYSALQVQPDLSNFGTGFQIGQGIQDARLANQAKQLAMQQAEAYRRDVSQYLQSPTAQGAAALALKYPQQREAVKQGWDGLEAADRREQGDALTQVYAAGQNGRPDIATDIIKRRIDAKTASGMDTSKEKTLLQLFQTDPQKAIGATGLFLAKTMDPDKFAAQYGQLGAEQRAGAEAPADLAIKNATANIKGVDAANAPEKAALDNANTRSEIEKRTADARIAELNTQISQANSETQRGQLTLERDKLVQAQQQKTQEGSAAAQDQRDALVQAQDTIGRIKSHPAVDGWFGAGSIAGKQLGFLPGTDRKELNGLIETFKSQQFLSQLAKLKAGGPSGLGGLTETEGERLVSAIGKLDPDMKPEAFRNALGVIDKTLSTAQERLTAGGKLPETGGAFLRKVPGIGEVREGDINRMLKSNPGSTREQVIKYLDSLSGANQIPGR